MLATTDGYHRINGLETGNMGWLMERRGVVLMEAR